MGAGSQDGRMFDLRGDDMTASFSLRLGDTLDRQIIGFRSPGEKSDLVRRRVQERGYLMARILYRLPRALAPLMRARGIAVDLAEIREHRLDHLVIHSRRRAVVQIDSP